jgi:hypothetical protein
MQMRHFCSTAASRVIPVIVGILTLLGDPAPSLAMSIAQWNFNISEGVNNAPVPSTGTGVAAAVGMTGGPNADILAAGGPPDSSDPSLPNNAWRVRGVTNNGWSGTTQFLSGARFDVSTAGYTNVSVSFDLLATDDSPRHGRFQYSLDGSTFTSLGSVLDFNAGNNDWVNGYTFDLSSVAGVNNNPSFAFRLVSAFSPIEFITDNGFEPPNSAFQRADATRGVYDGSAGNWRFDMVTVNGVPEPGKFAAMPLVFAAFALRWRSRR